MYEQAINKKQTLTQLLRMQKLSMVYRLTSHVLQTHDLRWVTVAKFFKTPIVVNVEL